MTQWLDEKNYWKQRTENDKFYCRCDENHPSIKPLIKTFEKLFPENREVTVNV